MPKKLIFVLLITLIIVIFAAQNADIITINIFFWDFSTSLAIIVFVCIFLGVLIGSILTKVSISKKEKLKFKELEKQNNRKLSYE